jgi:hypothetical protein
MWKDLLFLPQSLPLSIGKDMAFQLLHLQRNTPAIHHLQIVDTTKAMEILV